MGEWKGAVHAAPYHQEAITIKHSHSNKQPVSPVPPPSFVFSEPFRKDKDSPV